MVCIRSVRQIKLTYVGFRAHVKIASRIVSYRTVQLMPLHPKTPSSLALIKPRLVLPFWCWLAQVVMEKRPLNRCSSISSSSQWQYFLVFYYLRPHRMVGHVLGTPVRRVKTTELIAMPFRGISLYNTIRDAILTCARVSLIYCTGPTTKKCKTEKLKNRKRICSKITVNSLGNPRSQS